MSKKDNEILALQEDDELRKLLGEEEKEGGSSESDKERDKAQQELLGTLNKLVSGFLSTQDEVVKQSNENRSGLQDEIDHLHKLLLNGGNGQNPKPIRECEIDALARLRQIQADQTANRVSLMDSAAKMISALKFMLKDGNSSKKSRGDDDLRSMLGDGSGPEGV